MWGQVWGPSADWGRGGLACHRQLARFFFGEVGRDTLRAIAPGCSWRRRRPLPATAAMWRQASRVGLEIRGYRKIQSARKLVFGARQVLAAVERDAAVEVGFPRGQVFRRGERRAPGQGVIG